MPRNYQAELVGVLGTPVAENPTGAMQEAAFAALGLQWRYLTMEVQPRDLPAAIAGAKAMGFRGLNLTIPHKVAVLPLLDAVMKDAAVIGAVNTVRREGDRLVGENTDGKGFLMALRRDAGCDPRGLKAVLLGAGGAARAIGTELLLAGLRELTVVNRSPERGSAMVADLAAGTKGKVELSAWPAAGYTVAGDVDLLVNATSVGLYPQVEAIPAVDLGRAQSGMLAADAVFNPAETRFLRAAKAQGLRTLDGLSMLVYQGVIGFELWTGLSAPMDVMKQTLERELRYAS